MCGTPFPHRFLPVPEEQSALTFPVAPIEIESSLLPVAAAEPLASPTPEVTTAVEEVLPESSSVPVPSVAEVSLPTIAEEAEPLVASAAEPAVATPPPAEIPVFESAPFAEAGEPQPPTVEVLDGELAPLVEIAEVATAPEIIPVEPTSEEPLPSAAEPAPPAPVTHEHEAAPSAPSHLPEIRRYATPHRDALPAYLEAATPTPTGLLRPPAPQSLEPPPDSAGMPTFQAVVEAAGAPPISPFEPPVAKDADEERELQEYIASFQYHPPQEAVDELTMRSEVPVLDTEAPIAPSHPSFDDDVPPPPEAGPHPTGEEYYPPLRTSADRSGYLDIADTRHAGSGQHPPAGAGGSILGLDDASSSSAIPPDELAPPPRRHWVLWSSLGVILAIFGTFGYFEGRAQKDHAYQEPIAVIQQQYAKLRQWASELTASAPAPVTERQVSEAPAKVEPPANSPAGNKPATSAQSEDPATQNPPASSVNQPAPRLGEQPKPTTATTQATPAPENKPATTSAQPVTVTPSKPAVDTQPKPVPAVAEAKLEPAVEPPPAVAKPKSKPDPGQEELAKAMQASDPAAAAAWLWKATSRGNSVAPVRLADMYIKGKGVPHSCEQALVLLRSEAAKENAPARNRLAALYANGTCVARDRVKAYQFMSSALAADPTSEWAEQNRKELWQQMTPEERAQAEKYR